MIVIAPGVPSGTTNGPSGHGSRIEKYGPTVWEGVMPGTGPSAPLLEDGRVAAAQHDVPVVAEGPLGLGQLDVEVGDQALPGLDRKSTRLNSSHSQISYAVFCLKKKKKLYDIHVKYR